jgi:uncharacterized damage-inducible protein DinB
MKAFFQELFEYNHHSNQQIITTLEHNQDKVSEKCIKLQSHVLNAHRIWNCKLLPDQQLFGRWDIHPVQELSAINSKNFEASMWILDNFELPQIIQYTTSTGQVFNNSLRDILFHVINHSTYHRAQIATEFRLCGIEPLLTDYIFYKMQ